MMTITEALAEIKTLNARIAKKREASVRYFARDGRLKDPMAADGGSVAFVQRERQAIGDLEGRIVAIRTAIQHANLTTKLAIQLDGAPPITRSVAEWLTWRREVSAQAKAFLESLAKMLDQARAHAQKEKLRMVDADSGAANELVVAVNEQALAKDIEGMEHLLGTLDGKLSLVNATTTIDV